MNPRPRPFLAALCGILCVFLSASLHAAAPHILYIVADDLGWKDVGFHGAEEIKTPNLDKLAAEGARLERFYVQPMCTPTRACQTPVSMLTPDSKITTIEGVKGKAAQAAQAVQAAWQKLDVVQCGYCQSGQIMSAIALLTDNQNPTDQDIDAAMDGNVCRCATYVRIRAAIKDAAQTMRA